MKLKNKGNARLFTSAAEIQHAVSCQRFTAGRGNTDIVCRIAGKKTVGNFNFSGVGAVGYRKLFCVLVVARARELKVGSDPVVAVFRLRTVNLQRAKCVAFFNNGGESRRTGFDRKTRYLCKIFSVRLLRRIICGINGNGDGRKIFGGSA